MAWIESHQEIGRHPKTKRLARQLGVSLPAAIGHLQLLWWWSLDFAPDGSLVSFDDGDIADAMLWEDDPSTLINALISAGWIDADRSIHDWYEYAGKLIERRRTEAVRLRRYREANKHVQHTSDERTPYERSTLVVTVPDRTVPNPTLVVPEGLVGGSGGNDGSEGVGATAPPKPKTPTKASKGKQSAPESLEPNEADLQAGVELGFGPEIVADKAAAMLDHFRGKGEQRADWHATLRTWLRNAPRFDPTPTNGHVGGEAPAFNGVPSKIVPATSDDLAIWTRALEAVAATMNQPNFQAYVEPLTVAGRLENGGLCLVVPSGVGSELARFRQHIGRALEDAGDPCPTAVAFKARRQETSHAE